MDPCFIVICRADDEPDGTPGEYVLTTRRTFATRPEADKFAATIAPGRVPIVVECWKGLVYDAPAPAATWAGCCRASRRIWTLVNAMYQRSDPKQLALSPTATSAEIIACELGISIGE